MTTPLWALDLADDLRGQFRESATYPLPLRRLLRKTDLPLTIEELPRLTVSQVEWAMRKHVPRWSAGSENRALRACMAANADIAFVFLDADDPEDEQAFSLAHEVAHFLRDHRRPRDRVAHRIGPESLEAVDGKRPATLAERVHAVLRFAPLDLKLCLLTREDRARDEAEQSADVLACELLAPVGTVEASDAESGLRELCERFGLPPREAREYAARLWPGPPRDTLAARLRRAMEG
jgi:Zn-dependent peptidase ImmA (M78 family)